MMTPTRAFCFFLMGCVSLGGCELSSGKKKKQDKADNVVRTYDKQKQLVSEVPIKDKKRHGLAKTYYANGKLNVEMPYVEDQREGTSKKYYESGLLYQETDYKDDQTHGVQRKYEEKGLMSEARYEEGNPCTGLVEYNNGKERTDYPTLVIRPIDRIQLDGTYTILLSVTEGAASVKYYEGQLTKSGCMHFGLIPLPSGDKKSTGMLQFQLRPGQFLMQELNFIAAVTTRKGNTYLTQKTFPLSIEN